MQYDALKRLIEERLTAETEEWVARRKNQKFASLVVARD